MSKRRTSYQPKKAEPLARFSEHFGIDADEFSGLGVFDPLLERDAPFSINPKLLDASIVPEMVGAHADVLRHFTDIITLLAQAKNEDSVLWKQAFRLFDFPEFRGSSLGFSAQHGDGRGWPETTRQETLRVGKEIVDAGTTDPRIFELVGLFQENVGPDLISDMLGTILFERLANYTKRICQELNISTFPNDIHNNKHSLPTYLNERNKQKYVILVPLDILSELPQPISREDIGRVAAQNEALRTYFNQRLGRNWRREFESRKVLIKEAFVASPQFISEVLDRYKRTHISPYNFKRDAKNAFRWITLTKQIASENPIVFSTNNIENADDACQIVRELLEHFKYLVEHTRLQKALYTDDGHARSENILQDIFHAVALTHSIFSGLDVSPEVNSGPGPVDFKFSLGRNVKIVVELKLAKSSALIDGFEEQVKAYREAERADHAFYFIVNLGGDQSEANIDRLKQCILKVGDGEPEVIICDGQRRPSASRRRKIRKRNVSRKKSRR